MPDTPPSDEPNGRSAPPDGFGPAIEAAKAARRLQDTADMLKKQASLIKDPKEREHLIRAAYDKEVEAHGQSKKARAMASGWGQGAAAGVGIASAVGMGLGNLVGVLLSGVTAVPGVLVGSGVGAVHGPWFKLGPGKSDGKKTHDKAEEEHENEDEEEKMHRAIVEAAREADAKGDDAERADDV